MSSAGDIVRLQDSKEGISATPMYVAKKRYYTTVVDNNNTSYPTGQINVNLKALQGNASFQDVPNSYFEIPIELKVTVTTPGSGNTTFAKNQAQNMYAAWFKHSYYSIVQGLTCNINGQNIVNYQNGQHMVITWKIVTTFSEADLASVGAYIGAGSKPDTGRALYYNSGPTGSVGDTNGGPFGWTDASVGGRNGTTGWTTDGFIVGNAARTSRIRDCCVSTVDPIYLNMYTDTAGVIAAFKNSRKNFCDLSVDGVITYNIFATLPMRHLHDVFARFPLTRGLDMQLNLYTHLATNNCSATFKFGASTTTDDLTKAYAPISTLASSAPYGYFPFQLNIPFNSTSQNTDVKALTPYTAGFWNGSHTTGGTDVCTITAKIGNAHLTSCTYNACMVDLNNAAASAYVGGGDTSHEVSFIDNQYMCPNEFAKVSSTVTSDIVPSCSNLRGLLMIPVMMDGPAADGSSTLDGTTNGPVSSDMSPFGPSLSAIPFVFENLMVSLSGKTLLDRPLSVKSEQWVNLMEGVGNPHGNQVDGKRSGLLPYADFQRTAGWMYLDLNRKEPEVDNLMSQVKVSFQNSTRYKTMRIHAFVFFGRTIRVDVNTGAISL